MSEILFLLLLVACLSAQSAHIIQVEYSLPEEQKAGVYVGNIVNDANLTSLFDTASLRQLNFAFLRSPHSFDHFNLDPITGVMETGSKRLDRESLCAGQLSCHIRLDVGIKPSRFFHIIRISIELVDINDHAPTFLSSQQVVEVSESASVGSFYPLLSAVDPDSPANSVVSYRLSPVTTGSDENFILDWKNPSSDNQRTFQSPSPRLMLNRQLDREKQSFYIAELTAYDGASPAKSGKLRVEVRVMDANDNAPIFNQPSYEVTVPENVPLLTSIATVHAVDADEGLNGLVNYHLSSASVSNHGNTFRINNRTGEIVLILPLDFEGRQSYQLVVEAMDSGADPIVVSTLVTVNVADVNDNPPLITAYSMTSHDHYDAILPEDSLTKTFVSHLTVADHDSGLGGTINCSLRHLSTEEFASKNLKDDDKQLLSAVKVFKLVKVNENEYQVETAMALNREVKETYEFSVFCEDGGKPSLNSTKVLKVKVDDINDCTPTFSGKIHSFDLYENNYPGVAVMKITAEDCDVGDNGKMSFSLLSQRDSLRIDENTGLLTAEVSFDREVVGDRLSVEVMVKDNGSPQRSSTALFTINILDINDNLPSFEKKAHQFNITENMPDKTFIASLKATDADKPFSENSRIFYSILPGPSSKNFFISNLTGDLFTALKLDRESEAIHYLVVVAKDNGIPPLSSSSQVVVVVEDTNDNAPLFEVPSHNNFTFHLSSRAPLHYRVAKISAYDFDSGDNGRVVYAMDNHSLPSNGDLFHLDANTGLLTLRSADISHLDGTKISLKIWAKDLARPPEVPFKTDADVIIVINHSAPLLVNGKYVDSADWLLALGYYGNYTNNKAGFIYFVLFATFLLVALLIFLFCCVICCIRRVCNYSKSNTNCVRIGDFDNYNCRTEAMKKLKRLPLSSTVNTELMMAGDSLDDVDDNSHLVVDEIIDGNCSFIGGLNHKNLSQLSDNLHFNTKARTLDQLRLSTPQLQHHSSGYSCSSHTIDASRHLPQTCQQQQQQQHHSNIALLHHLQEQQHLLNQHNKHLTLQQQHQQQQQQQQQHQQQQQQQSYTTASRLAQKWRSINPQHNGSPNHQHTNCQQSSSPRWNGHNSLNNNNNSHHGKSTWADQIKFNESNEGDCKSKMEVTMEAESEVKHLLSLLKDEGNLECLSLSSEQGANSDSGRGASEEGGDAPKNPAPPETTTTLDCAGATREISRNQCSTDC